MNTGIIKSPTKRYCDRKSQNMSSFLDFIKTWKFYMLNSPWDSSFMKSKYEDKFC